MGIVRLNQLPDGSGNLTNDDIFLFMDDPSGSGITKKISLSEIASAVGGGGGNPFDQTLNTFNSPTFNTVAVTGSQIFGGGINSGDGNGYGTIELVPDSGLYNNDQYLIVDPTAPNHIHLRAGGNIDDSNAELVVGGEYAHLSVTDYNHQVAITASGIGQSTWNFQNDGNLSIPGNILLSNGTSVATGTYYNGTSGGNNGISLNCAAGYELNWQGGHLRSSEIGNSSVTQPLFVDSPLQLPGSGSNYMTVSSSGLAFPDGTVQTTAGGGGNPFDWTLILNSDNTISAYNLTSIGDNQFSGNTGIGLRIGSVTSIGSYAFRYCSGLSGNLTIPNSVTSIGNYAFNGCSGFSGNLVLPNSVTSIGNDAFSFCGNFSGNLTIPDSVTTIGSAAFGACAGFDGNLTIGNSVTTIGSAAFAYCSGFDGNLTIGNSVTTIGSYAFYNCSGLTNVNCYAPSTVFPNSNELSGCTFSTFHVRSSDNSWTAGSTTLGGHTFTVIKDL